MPVLYVTNFESEADLKVFVTDNECESEIIVYKIPSRTEALSNNLWYITERPSSAGKKIFYVNNKSKADIKVFFTEFKSRSETLKSR